MDHLFMDRRAAREGATKRPPFAAVVGLAALLALGSIPALSTEPAAATQPEPTTTTVTTPISVKPVTPEVPVDSQ